MLRMATFYRRTNFLFEGALTIRSLLNIDVKPAGLIRTSGKDGLRVQGVADSVVRTEEIHNRLSTYMFDHVDFIEPLATSFTGKVFAADPGGVAIPVNSILFNLPVELAYPYIVTSSPIRTQEELGATPVDKIVNITVKFSLISTLKINDYVIIGDIQYVIKNLHSINPGHWLIQTILKDYDKV